MPEPSYLYVTDNVVMLAHEPGNGTRYTVVIAETSERGRWCVSFPDFGSSYWVEEDSMDVPMHPNYVAEKWRIGGHEASPVDAVQMAHAVFLAFRPVLTGKF